MTSKSSSSDPAPYLVVIQDWKGRREVACQTEAQVWKTIGQMYLGGLYEVSSPQGLPVYQFLPF